MKIIKKIQLFLLLVLALGSKGIANEIELSLTEAKRIALEQNKSLQVAEQQYQAGLARVKQSEAKNSPQIGLVVKPTTSIGENASVRGQVGLNFSQPYPSSPDLAAAIKTHEFDLQIAERARKEAQRQLLWQVETAYFNLLKANQLLAATDESLRRAKAQLETSQLQEEVGTGTHLDVMRMQVALARSKQSQLEAQNNVRKASANLALLLGLPVDSAFITSTPASSEVPSQNEALTMVADRSELLDLEAAVEKAKLALEQVQRQKEMKLSLISSYNHGKGDLSLGIDKNSISGSIQVSPNSLPQSGQWQIGIEARWDLADGGAGDASIREAQAIVFGQQEQLQNKAIELEQEIRSLYWDLEVVESKLETADANLNIAKETWDIAKLKFDNGVGSASELLDVEVSVAEAQAEYINTYFDWLIKQRQLLFNLCSEGEVL
jgi:outer membrane protein TolC